MNFIRFSGKVSLKFSTRPLLVGRKGGLVLVDSGNPGDGKRIVRSIAEAGYRPEDVSLIVVTHGHRDHVGGLVELTDYVSAKTIIHHEDAGALTEGREPEVDPVRFPGRLVQLLSGERDYPLPAEEPELAREERINLSGFGVEGEILHIPGHTRGSLGVVSEDGKAVVGDLVMGRFVLFGKAALPAVAEDPGSVRDNIRKVLERGPEIIYSSHGGPFPPEDLERLLGGDDGGQKGVS